MPGDSHTVDVEAASVAGAAPIMLAIADVDARLVWHNRQWSELTGRGHDDIAGDAWFSCIPAEDRARLQANLRTRAQFAMDLRIRRHDGRERWMAVHGTPRDDDTSIISATDVTESRASQFALELLADVGDELNATLAVEELLGGVARAALLHGFADQVAIAVMDDEGRLTRVAVAHADKERESELQTKIGEAIDVDGPTALAQAVRSETVLYRPIVDAPGPDEPWSLRDPSEHARELVRSLVCTPLRGRDGVVGAAVFVSASRLYTPDDVELAQELGRRCASGVDNATLYRRSEEARARLSLVASVGEQLAATFDARRMAETLVRRIVPIFADAASLALLEDNGTTLRRRAFCHVDPEREAEFRAQVYDEPISLEQNDPPARAVRTGRAVLIENYGSRQPGAAARMLLPTSVLSVPVATRRARLGVLNLAFTTSGRHYTVADLPLALDLARRAALAIERAEAFAHERRVTEALQHSMLPDELPDIPGVSCSARYLPGDAIDIGGDWYDVVPLAGGRHGVVIGDVAGHGIRAATVMGHLRHALRAFAADGRDPASIIERLNRFVFEQGPLDMTTVCCGVLDPATGALQLSSAGHVPPLVINADRSIETIDLEPAPPVGADPLSRYRTVSVKLAPGSTLLLYTDGLVERRGETLDVGLNRLVETAGLAPSGLDDACDYLLERLVGDDRAADDVAVLALRFVGPPRGRMKIRRRANSAELAPVRRILASWLEAGGFGAEEIGSITVAVSEAATNAIEHAYGPGEGWFEVAGEIDERGTLNVTVRDNGRWRPKARGGGGRGLALIARLMDAFEVRRHDTGTEIWMRRAPRGERRSV